MISLDEVIQSTGIPELVLDSKGKVRFQKGLSLAAKKKYLCVAHTVYRRKDVGWKLLLGNMVNDLRLPYGQKKDYCLKAFGEQAGLTVYGYANTAAHWDDERQDYDLPWSLYKDAGLLTSEVKSHVIEKFLGKVWNLDECREFCRKWKEENMPRNSQGISSDLKTGEKQRNSPLVSLSTNSGEFLEAGLQFDPAGQRILVFGEDDETPIRSIGKQDGPSLVAFAFSVATPQQLRAYAADACSRLPQD